MTEYSFSISNGGTTLDTLELPDDDHAWREAKRTLRNAEDTLSPTGGEWSLVVAREGEPIFRIRVFAEKLR